MFTEDVIVGCSEGEILSNPEEKTRRGKSWENFWKNFDTANYLDHHLT